MFTEQLNRFSKSRILIQQFQIKNLCVLVSKNAEPLCTPSFGVRKFSRPLVTLVGCSQHSLIKTWLYAEERKKTTLPPFFIQISTIFHFLLLSGYRLMAAVDSFWTTSLGYWASVAKKKRTQNQEKGNLAANFRSVPPSVYHQFPFSGLLQLCRLEWRAHLHKNIPSHRTVLIISSFGGSMDFW